MRFSEATTIDQLARRGFTDAFRIADGRLHVLGTATTLRPADVLIREVHRFEGVSDPDDMAVLYVIESPTGIHGTPVDAYGVYADPDKSAVLAGIPFAAPTRAGRGEDPRRCQRGGHRGRRDGVRTEHAVSCALRADHHDDAGLGAFFTLQWTVEPERDGSRRLEGYVETQYGEYATDLRLLVQAVDG
jgi:hypothetical protein